MAGRENRPTASVHIDGLNLYRRLLEGHPECKWLDVEALAREVLPEYEIVRVRYFTAIAKALPGADVDSPQRQQAYLRALATLPYTTIHLGKFRIDPRVMPAHPAQYDATGDPIRVKVKKPDEKGSDVALASMLLIDAMTGDSDVYAVCTNDSDLTMPLRLVKDELRRNVGLISPMQPKRASNELKQTQPIWHRQITPAKLATAQLPNELTDDHGVIRRPAASRRSGGIGVSGWL